MNLYLGPFNSIQPLSCLFKVHFSLRQKNIHDKGATEKQLRNSDHYIHTPSISFSFQ